MNNGTAYDVIIVGGGPAGSTAGYLLSRSGLKVLIIDKNTFPRHKLCGGCITDKTVRLLKRVFGITPEDLKEKGAIDFESDRFEIFYKAHSILKGTSPVPFYFVNRCLYDNVLLEKTRQSGAEIITGDGAVSFDISNNEVRTASGRTLTGQLIIGADGVNSLIRRQFPDEVFDRKNWQKSAGSALEIFIDRSAVRAMEHPTLYLGYIEQGYAWVFPNKDKFVIGIGGLAQENRKRFLTSFSGFLSGLGVRNPGAYRVRSYSFPYGNYLLRPVSGRAILVGDAAGFADPLLGEGIFYAQRSAELASQVVSETAKEGNRDLMGKRAAAKYIRLLRENMYEEFEYAQKTRNFLFTYLIKFHYLPLKILMNVLGAKPVEAVQGIRSYKWMKRKGPQETS